MYLGKTAGRSCGTSRVSPNESVSITGMSGTGKTSRMFKIELEEVKRGNTVLVIDSGRTHLQREIFPGIRHEYIGLENRIDAITDGLDLSLLSPLRSQDGKTESFVSFVNSAVQGLGSSFALGVRQQGVLREVVIEAVNYLQVARHISDVEALVTVFERRKDAVRDLVYQKLWPVLHCNVLRPCTKPVLERRINIIDLSGVDMMTRIALTEMILAQIWRIVCFSGQVYASGNLTLVLDEYQRLCIRKGSILRCILTEGRKFRLNLLLGTQTLDIFPTETASLLNQSATQLYFRPSASEVAKIAKRIDPVRLSYWSEKLRGLQFGECIAVGTKEVCGHEVSRPLVLI